MKSFVSVVLGIKFKVIWGEYALALLRCNWNHFSKRASHHNSLQKHWAPKCTTLSKREYTHEDTVECYCVKIWWPIITGKKRGCVHFESVYVNILTYCKVCFTSKNILSPWIQAINYSLCTDLVLRLNCWPELCLVCHVHVQFELINL